MLIYLIYSQPSYNAVLSERTALLRALLFKLLKIFKIKKSSKVAFTLIVGILELLQTAVSQIQLRYLRGGVKNVVIYNKNNFKKNLILVIKY